VTSAVYSPRLQKNIALAMVDSAAAILGAQVEVTTGSGVVAAQVVERPFYDPSKTIAAA
jgi:aminomethyltransferase